MYGFEPRTSHSVESDRSDSWAPTTAQDRKFLHLRVHIKLSNEYHSISVGLHNLIKKKYT